MSKQNKNQNANGKAEGPNLEGASSLVVLEAPATEAPVSVLVEKAQAPEKPAPTKGLKTTEKKEASEASARAVAKGKAIIKGASNFARAQSAKSKDMKAALQQEVEDFVVGQAAGLGLKEGKETEAFFQETKSFLSEGRETAKKTGFTGLWW